MTIMNSNRESNAVGGPQKRSLLDGIITGLFGPSTDQMTPEDANATEADRSKDRGAASKMAVNAAENPGDQFMSIPLAGGSDGSPLSLLGDIMKMFSGGGGGAK